MKNTNSVYEQNGYDRNSILNENYLFINNFTKKTGRFGNYYQHEDSALFRCWFLNGNLQVGKKSGVDGECFWVAAIQNEIDFKNIYRIITSKELLTTTMSLELNGYSFETGV
ncbi:hypothetical protein [Halpernia frigidisoli]|uniref:Uncharacterized protein n=1 Tax=Halpernia frigidisoli TaxID=1125876 RepID=A0A1I3D4N3_9FLAO|nr:hypothetical protein [Halpernia frigidisoli]SFH81481.1 hypothetical protein SAMN05443292_0248 [Halpernia frigidisoli]